MATLAMLLLVNVGAYVESKGWHWGFKANTDPRRTHSLYHLGLAYLLAVSPRAPKLRLLARSFDSPI